MTLTAHKEGRQYLVPAAMIELGAKDVETQFGVTFDRYDTNGLGMALGHAFKAANGEGVYLEQHEGSQKPYLYVNCDHRLDNEELKQTLLHTFKALSVYPDSVTWVRDEMKATVQAHMKPRPMF